MSRRALTLSIRPAASQKSAISQWTCRRCLATQTQGTTPVPSTDIAQSSSPEYDPTLPASKRIGPDGKVYRLSKTDFNLKKPLPQARIPIAYLQHSTSEILHAREKEQRERTVPHKTIVGVVISAGKMMKTVKVRVGGQTWNRHIGKYFKSHEDFLTHDPNSSLVEGDVVELHRLRVSKRVGHVVASIISPFGSPVEDRPPIPTADDRLASYKAGRFEKLKRRSLRMKAADGDSAAIQELRTARLDPGHGTESGVGKSGASQPHAAKSTNLANGVIIGEKGQKLPKRILPGGEHEVGKIDERAKHNKEKAMRLNAKAEGHVLEAKEMGKDLEQQQRARLDSAVKV